jgi:hypothetical protein
MPVELCHRERSVAISFAIASAKKPRNYNNTNIFSFYRQIWPILTLAAAKNSYGSSTVPFSTI